MKVCCSWSGPHYVLLSCQLSLASICLQAIPYPRVPRHPFWREAEGFALMFTVQSYCEGYGWHEADLPAYMACLKNISLISLGLVALSSTFSVTRTSMFSPNCLWSEVNQLLYTVVRESAAHCVCLSCSYWAWCNLCSYSVYFVTWNKRKGGQSG